MAWQRSGETLMQEWTLTWFRAEHLGLESGMFTNVVATVRAKLSKSVLRVAAVPEKSTDVNITQVDSKMLRGGGKNAVVFAMHFTSHAPYKRAMAILVHTPKALSQWEGDCAKRMVSRKCRKFL